MLKQTKDATDRGLVLDLGGQNQLVNLGSFKSLIYMHQEDLSLKWDIEWSINFNNSELYKNSVEVVLKNKEIKVNSLILISRLNRFEIKSKNDTSNEYEVITEKVTSVELKINQCNRDETEFCKTDKESFNISSPPIKTHLFPIDFKNQTINIESAYERILDKIYYLAPLREYPKREYQWSGASPSGVGYRGEYAINAILAATFRNETRIIPDSNEEKPFQEVIAYWLKKLGLIHEFKITEIAEGTGLFHAIVKKEPESTEALLTDVGFGVSQVLPALVLLYYVPEDSIILMEQPEIHLHPSVQSGLADVILQVSKQRNIQVIVESHSEHLLQRFQRRVAEESYPVEELKLYFCDSKQGESKLMDLEIDEFGDIKNYPDNFFGDEMAEMAATHKAALKRKIKAQTK
jgi:predicted ATPase